ncbi:MAG: hypothetical protein Q9163_000539 [Psora crenata]
MVSLGGDFSASPAETTTSHASPAFQNGTDQVEIAGPNPPSSLQKRATPPAPNGLNPRSCVTCRKRKVKCDKRHPCSNCIKAAIECIFPGPGRAPRRSRKPPDTELLARLRRLEGVVQSLGKGIDDGGDVLLDAQPGLDSDKPTTENGHSQSKPNLENAGLVGAFEPKNGRGCDDAKTNGMVKEFGRLVVEEGRSRYVSNKFWTSLSEEVTEMRDILDDPTDEEEDYASPGSGTSALANHQGFIFSFSSTILSLRNFHPPPEHIPIYWNIFKSNVDPVLKLLHIPTAEVTVLQTAQDLDHVSKPIEALLFSIYFASVNSLSPDDCVVILGTEKQPTLRKYRFAAEQAFARAGFLSTQELVILQAMLLFLTCVRRTDDTRYVWTLTGLLIRLANALGIHRDGRQFNLSPFETELRRRLWWQICTLDVRASEDHGCDPSIVEQTFDTNFPLNINDVDIYPSMKEPPEEYEGATEMTFDLIRYSVSTTVRRLSYAPPGPGPCRTKSAGLSLEDKEKMIEELHQYIEKKYLRYCDTTTVPLHWVAATVARLILAKMWLVVHHPFQRSDAGAGLPQETKDRLFHTSVEVIEFSRLLETEKTTLKWGWLFCTYVQWHALAFVLSQLCTRTLGPDVDRAWVVIEGVFDEWGGSVNVNQRGMLWKPLRKLMIKARSERAKALQKRAMFPLDGSIGPVTKLNTQHGPDMNGSTMEIPTFKPSGEARYNGIDEMNNIAGIEHVSNGLPTFDPMLANEQAQTEKNEQDGPNDLTHNIDRWNPDPALFTQEPSRVLEDNSNGVGWDDMLKVFDINGAMADGDDVRGRGLGGQGLTNWW